MSEAVAPGEPRDGEYLARLAWDEAIRGLQQQGDMLDEFRQRATALVGIGGIAVGLLGDEALARPLRLLPLFGLEALVVGGIAAIWAMFPRRGWSHRIDPRVILDHHLDVDGGPRTPTDSMRYLAKEAGDSIAANQKHLDRVATALMWCCGAVAVEILCFVIDIPTR
jgi:hypothetical protein